MKEKMANIFLVVQREMGNLLLIKRLKKKLKTK